MVKRDSVVLSGNYYEYTNGAPEGAPRYMSSTPAGASPEGSFLDAGIAFVLETLASHCTLISLAELSHSL
jgi:hypothetical protein